MKSSPNPLWRTLGQKFDPPLSLGVGGVGNCRMRGDKSANGVQGFWLVFSHNAVADRVVRNPVMSVRKALDILPFTGGTSTISAEIGDTSPSSEDDDR